uniref:hypothetical protein n=1 Tax=Serratia marcescens TaxID=615 RepID=UPI003517EF53
MAKTLPESSVWVDNIFQIETDTPVLGGPNGPDNWQAQQLANRTSYLHSMLQGLQIDAPFGSPAEAQAAIDAGKIANEAIFTVRSDSADYWLIEYKNANGVAEPTGKTILSGELVLKYIEQVKSTLQVSADSLFDIVSSNGVRPFRIRDNDGTIEFEMVAKLVTGNAGLNFAGSSVDYFAPPGWLFVIYSANGLVIAGVKDDGTKIGWGDGSGGGGQSGEIIPGDTAASYDAIRQYDGEATVKDVIGNRIAGRFVVDAGDTTSPDDDGGCLVDTLGRRWKRSADYVSFDMFGAPRIPESVYQQFASLAAQGDHAGAAAIMADQVPADTAIRACFAFANALNIPVRQDAGRFLWKNTEIEVKVNSFLSGATIVTTDISGVNQDRWGPIPGVDDNAPEPVRMFTIRGRKPVIELTPAQINLLNTT